MFSLNLTSGSGSGSGDAVIFRSSKVVEYCPFDIVIVDRNGKIQLVDIKCATFRKHKKGKSLKDKPKGSYRISRSPTKLQRKLKVKLKMFHYD